MDMRIEEQFNYIAHDYDKNRRQFIPCFDDFYGAATKMIAEYIDYPKRVIDLGAGTGLLTSYWLREFPKSEYVLIDIAKDMLEVSKVRFSGMYNIWHEVMDYSEKLPAYDFDAVISALSIHHLTDERKYELFKRIHESLPEGGIFANYDQFCGNTDKIDRWYDSCWERFLYSGELTKRDIQLWKERRKLDKECSTEKEMDMLRQCGFKEASCIYTYHKFSVIAARK